MVHGPAFLPQQAVGHAAAPEDVVRCDLPETPPELGLLQIDDLAAMTLGAALLPHHPADKAFRSPLTLLQNLDGSAATLRAQKLPSARSHCFAEALRVS